MPATGGAVLQGLVAYHQERGNLATLSSQQRPSRATLSSSASRSLIGAGQLCHAPPAAMPATGGADLQGLAAYHQERGNLATLLSQQHPSRATLFSLASRPLIGARHLCHAPLVAMPATGIAILQGLAAYQQERGNLASLPSQQRPSRATLSSSASRPLIGAGHLCHVPPAAMPAIGSAARQGLVAYHQNACHGQRCSSRPSGLVSGAGQPRHALLTAAPV